MIIVAQCKDQVGLVASVSGVIASENINIISLREYVDQAEGLFFLRVEVGAISDILNLRLKIQSLLPADATVRINSPAEKKVVLLVSKEYHCLSDLLVRNHYKTLGATIEGVIGTDARLEDICKRFGIQFFPVSAVLQNRAEMETQILKTISGLAPDYLILAKFMRVLSADFVAQFPEKIINIHHSFLPAFVGANPYKRAYERGVKLIGATAHFVTNELDEGPIIAQQTIPVNHAHTAQDMIRAGKEIETSVLANAVRMVIEDRVFVYKNKTVVFE